MGVETEVKKEGIKIISKLDTLTVNSIARNITNILCSTYPEQNLDCNDLFISISRLNMYIAEMPNDNSKAKYYHKNSSLYFDKNVDFNHLDKCIVHECIHVIQSKKDIKNNVVQLGLCDFSRSNFPGMALNEAVVQLMAEKCVNSKPDSVKYFGIDISTTSPDYYPLECTLANQMSYITGESVMYDSALYGNTNFKDTFTYLTNNKAYSKIEKNIDKIMNLEDDLQVLNYRLENSEVSNNAVFKLAAKISSTKKTISNLFINTQNLIITSYFNQYYTNLSSSHDIENFRNKLYNFKNYIGVTDDYTFYNEYYLKMMALLEEKYETLNNPSVDLTVYKPSAFNLFINKISKLFGKNKTNEINNKINI